MPTPYQALFYDYVENAVEARKPFREEHLELVARYVERGEMSMGGALGNPPHGGLLVFPGDDPSVVERFVSEDPYVAGGVVTHWRVEPWTVVT